MFAYVKLFTQRLQARIKRRSSNNHSHSLPAIDHSNTYQKPKAFSNKEPHGNLQPKFIQRSRSSPSTTHDKTSRPIFKQLVTNQQENPCDDSGFSSNNRDAPHLQNICYRNDSQQPQPLLQSSHKDQSLQPNTHHRSQKADLYPQPPLPVEHTKEEQSTQCLNRLQQTTAEIQSTLTDLVPPRQQIQYESMEDKSQNESVFELQTDLSASLSLPPTSLISTV